MRRSRYKKRRYYGKGAKDLIRPTLNKGRIFVGEGLLKKGYKKKKKVYRKGAKDLIRPTLNKGKIFVGQGLLKKSL